ncbi:SDR family NAD(P)-dependent oxidoreductase [Streptomyces sp. NPDC058045]|uniref:SDR family NAD(P)-dependent oxidoreductase n=1 Tax=Streptomyces sp. NPDC058045 TaxID=3346311 RepID=UPI0036E02E30
MTSPTDTRPLAVVTGAAGGTGLELAALLAEDGFDLVLADAGENLPAAADEARVRGADVLTVTADLATAQGNEQLLNAVTAWGRAVVAAALTADPGSGGPFTGSAAEDDLRVVDLCVASPVRLAKGLLRHMTARGEGTLVLAAPPADTTGAATVYDASAAFLDVFAGRLRGELGDTGVMVTALTGTSGPGTEDPARLARRAHRLLAQHGPRRRPATTG